MANSYGKLTKHKFLSMSAALIPALPDTQKMSKNSFISFMRKYHHIIAKPSNGLGGAGVIQITTIGFEQYRVHYGKQRKTIIGLLPTYSFVRSIAKGLYLVQQRIKLATINERPFDLRVMVQRKRNSGWTVTGILAKIAGSGYFITNIVRSNGRAMPLYSAIPKSNISGYSYQGIRKQINQLAISTVKRLQKHYRINTVGIDMGIDTQGKVWIIEANFSPDKTYFLRLKDKAMYRRIMSYYKKR